METDALIIGSGAAGLTAVVSAKEQGIENVMVIEKMPFVGGASAMAHGVWAAGAKAQIDAGVTNDSADILYDDLMVLSQGESNPMLTRMFADNSGRALDWLMDNYGMGVDGPSAFEGASVERNFIFDGSGAKLIEVLNENALETSNVPSPDVTAVGTDGIPAELFAPMEDSATSSNDVNASENHEDIVNTIQEQPSPEVDTSQSVGEENVTDVPNVINGMEIVDFDLDNKDEVNTIEQSMSDNVEAEPSIDSTALANENEVAENTDVQPNEEVSSDQSNVENADIQPNIENTPEQPSLENTDVQPEAEQEPAIDVELPDLNSEVDQAEEDVWKF